MTVVDLAVSIFQRFDNSELKFIWFTLSFSTLFCSWFSERGFLGGEGGMIHFVSLVQLW
jgi:uncharacterized membrane protein